MSRCFPFPPPGYEREHKLEDLALLKEVKLKEKKHKNDKEKRKDKEKKEKDGSSEKQRDKKDRKRKHKDKKEKHRDKKKEKEDRVKDKDKSSISEESTVAGKFDERSGEKSHSKGHNKDSGIAEKGNFSALCLGQNGGKPQGIFTQAINDAKFVQELDRRIRDDGKVGRSAFSEKRDQEAAATGIAHKNSSRPLGEDKSNDRDKRVHIKKMEPQRLDGEFTGKAMAENLARMGKSKNEGPPIPVEEQNDRRLDNKEKYKETGDDERERKQKERDKKSQEKDKDKKKEKKREEKRVERANLTIESKKSEHEKSANVLKNDRVVAISNMSTKFLKDDCSAPTEENVRKRKDMDSNGFLHESEIRPNKVQGIALHQSTDNGKKLEAFHIPSKSFSGKHPVANNARSDHLDRLINGVNEAQKPSSSKPNFPSTNIVSDQIVASRTTLPDISRVNEAHKVPKMKDPVAEEAPRKPPHPDSKYLQQVLTVPKVEDWLGDDDEEWLFSTKGPPKRPHLEFHGVKDEPHVWSEAVHIESTDVYALPYVIPY